jgi:hypothetical protein
MPTAATTTVDRAERIERMHDAWRARPLQSLTLQVEDADGAAHRIRVDLRGDAVAADIATGDINRASQLHARLGDLRQRLGEHGFEPAALQVRPLGTTAPTDAGAARQQPQQESDRSPQHQQHHHQPRHRARREQEGESR